MAQLSTLDLLSLGDDEQEIVRCLIQQPGLTLAEIAQRTRISSDRLEAVLSRMLQMKRLVEQLKDRQRIFSVRFTREMRRVRNVPPAILDVLQQSPEAFLAQTLLTEALDSAERRALLQQSITRVLVPGEVLIWQGDPFEYVGLVRQGLLKKSRLQVAQHSEAATGYVRRTEWFGLSEVLSSYASTDTYTAVIDTEILLWPSSVFLEFASSNARLSNAICRWIGQQLHQCQEHQRQGQIWVVSGVSAQVGTTTVAANLARLAANPSIETSGHPPKVLLWRLAEGHRSAMRYFHNSDAVVTLSPSDLPGVDVLNETATSDYPPQVYLDILLTDLQRRYSHIICDTGANQQDELVLRLRGLGHVLITLTTDPTGVQLAADHASHSRPYARPGQKRMLVLNRSIPQTLIDPAFHLVLPYDDTMASMNWHQGLQIVDALPQSQLSQALAELHRRLSLSHSIGIFIPSTIDVNQIIDNSTQVQHTMAFLGKLFGGATRNESEGVWHSESSGLVVEQVTVVRSFVSRQALEQKLDEVIAFVTNLKREMRQEAVAVDVDNQLVLV